MLLLCHFALMTQIALIFHKNKRAEVGFYIFLSTNCEKTFPNCYGMLYKKWYNTAQQSYM